MDFVGKTIIGERPSNPDCPSSNKWGRFSVRLRESFAHHFHIMVPISFGIVQVPSHRVTDGIEVIDHLRALKIEFREALNSL